MAYFAFLMALLSSVANSYEIDFAQNSELGKIARIDLINTVNIALDLATPPATETEKNAALEFAKFLNGSECDEYLEAFYTKHTIDDVNNFVSFLNGFIFNGSPYLPAWHAAEALIIMIKTKTSLSDIELEREKAKRITQDKSQVGRVTNGRRDVTKNYDYIKLFEEDRIFPLRSMINSARKKYRYIKP